MKYLITFILFLQLVLGFPFKNNNTVNFYTVTDDDNRANFSFVNYNSFNFKTNELKILSNFSVFPCELSNLVYNNKKLYSVDDTTGFLYEINPKNKNIKKYDQYNNFHKGEAMTLVDNDLYIYNYTGYNKKINKSEFRYNLVKYNFKNKKVDKVYNLTDWINLYLDKLNYKFVAINAIDINQDKLYLVPRYYHNFKNKIKYNNNHFYVISYDGIQKIKLSEKIPKKHSIVDMDIYDDKIYFIASLETKSNKFKTIFFITDLQGNLLTEYIEYDKYNKYEGISVVPSK